MGNGLIDYSKYKKLSHNSFFRVRGKVVNVVGLTIESAGPQAKMGDICYIYPMSKDGETTARPSGKGTMAEVVGFRDNHVLLMPYENLVGIGSGSIVENTDAPLRVNVGEGLLGKTLDGLGRVDGTNYGKGAILENGVAYSVENQPPDPMTRDPISDVLSLGVKAVDGLLTVGKGQRIGIFAGSGVGKSTLMGMFARNTEADINVIALIGERGREVREFIERDLGEEGMARSIVVVATSDKPALERLKAAKTATSIAEYFRDKGKDVLLMMDSLTRFSMAQREIGLASGEPPVSRGYPPSVYAEMPKLLERAGRSRKGSITGLYTVLVDGDDFNEPITDTARGILDGHIVLDRKLAQKNHYPAIDVLASISRCMSAIAPTEQKRAAGKLKNVLATYKDAEDLINIGAYKAGANKNIDYAVSKIDAVNNFLMQETDEKFTYEEVVAQLEKLFAN
ncbi:flagellar protein export ATPase FliI [Butyrivibrio sp. NC2002]|jgi:flagellum-specific ATP synthase|uniref:flagellar protein export ATPase FliI n=1 Tax=Butyrivibrio sp. NC2002 TaxID=1410610 RepID=UPI00056090DE|nr:flagellar protein export ATPase FliI [Butyrivibrio sp. NC2002]